MANYKNFIKQNRRFPADYEAEGGETRFTQQYGLQNIVGNSHANGGVRLESTNGDINDFIFSNEKSTHKLKDKEILKMLGLPKKRGGYTYAELSKHFSTAGDIATLYDKNADEMEKETAIKNIKNKNNYLGLLAMFNQATNGNPAPEISESAIDKFKINPNEIIPPMQVQNIQPDVMPIKNCGGTVKKLAGGDEVDNDEFFTSVAQMLGLEQKNSELLGSYGEQLTKLRKFFKENPKELDSLYKIWKDNADVKANNYDLSKENFIDQYATWLMTKQAWRNTGEGGKANGYWDEVSPNSATGKQRRNTKEYHDAFKQFSGMEDDDIGFFQTMDIAMNDYANKTKSDKFQITSDDVWTEDPNSDAGKASTTSQKNREGVSVMDRKFGKRTADMLPYIVTPEEKKKEEQTTETKTYDHIGEGAKRPYDPRFFPQDINNLIAAAAMRMNDPQYYMQEVRGTSAEPKYVDYRRQAYGLGTTAENMLGALAKSADDQANAANILSAANAVSPQIGQAFANEANTNVGIYNQFAGANAQIENQLLANQAAARKRFFDETQVGRQQKTNAQNQKYAQYVRTLNNAMTNRDTRELLNELQKNYYYTADNRVAFLPDTEDINPKKQTQPFIDLANTLKDEFHLSEKDSVELALKAMGKGSRINLEDLAKLNENI